MIKKLLILLCALLLVTGCTSETKEPEPEPIGFSQPYYVLTKGKYESLNELKEKKIAYQTSFDKEETAYIVEKLVAEGFSEENLVEYGDYKTIASEYKNGSFDAWVISESANELVGDYQTDYAKDAFNKVTEITVPYYEEKEPLADKIANDPLFTEPFMVMINGLDERIDPEYNQLGRNDVNHLMVVDPIRKHILTVSFPRDTYLYIPSLGYSAKLCEIGVYGGKEAIRDAVGNILDIEIENYVQVSFSSFIEMINDFGGVWVDVPLTFTMDQNSYRDVKYPTGCEKGLNKLYGEWALALARNRKYNGIYNGDYGRIRNQMLIINSLISKIANHTEILRWTGMVWRAKFLASTNFTDEQMEVLINLADKFAEGYTVDNWFIHNDGGTASNGAWIGIIQPYTLAIAKGKIELALTGEISEDNPYYEDIMEGYVSKGASTTGYEGETYDLSEVYK